MNRDTQETLIWIFCIVVVLAMAVKVETESSDYDCSDCTVSLSNTIVGTERPYDFGTFVIKDLFRELTEEGYCSIKWDPTQGYYRA